MRTDNLRSGSTPASQRLGYSDYLDDDGFVLSSREQAKNSRASIERKRTEQGVRFVEQIEED